jgi:serine/threonine-protein kinase
VPEHYRCPQGHRWEASPSADPNQTTDLQVLCPVCGAPGEVTPKSGPAAPPSEAETVAPLPNLELDSSSETHAPPAGAPAPGAGPAAPADLPVIPGYEILGRVGAGGMGQVYKARHVRLDRVVALKVIQPERLGSPDAVRRFYREARAAARLVHPNLVTVYDVDEAGGVHFLAMEYVDGVDLGRQVRERGPLPVARACEYARQAADGLQHVHERGLVHRDIKPANLLLSPDGRQVKILDLGLARLDAAAPVGEGTSELTQSGTLMGTPAFLAPEQARDARRADIRSDLYSLGCTLYYLLTGRQPFPGQSLAEVIVQHQLDEPESVTKLRPDVPAGVAAVLRRLMAKRPEDRYQTPAEAAVALAPFCPAPSSVPTLDLAAPGPAALAPAPPEPPTARYSGSSLRMKRLPPLDPGRARRRLLVLAGGAVLWPLLCCGGCTALWLFGHRPATSSGSRAVLTVPATPPFLDTRAEKRDVGREMRGQEAGLKKHEAVLKKAAEMAARIHRRAAERAEGYDKAIDELTEAIRQHPEATSLYQTRGRFYCQRGLARNDREDFDRAVADFTQAINREPTSHQHYNYRQWAHLLREDADAALADITKAIGLRPREATLYSNRAEVYLTLEEDPDAALADLERALRIDPRLADAYALRAAVHNARREYDEAIADANKAIDELGYPPGNLLPTRNSAFEARGYARLKKDDLDGALADLNRAIDQAPYNARPYLLRSEVYAKKGDKERAEKDYAEAVRRDPRLKKKKDNKPEWIPL